MGLVAIVVSLVVGRWRGGLTYIQTIVTVSLTNASLKDDNSNSSNDPFNNFKASYPPSVMDLRTEV